MATRNRGATPQWYKAHAGVRRQVQSGAARWPAFARIGHSDAHPDPLWLITQPYRRAGWRGAARVVHHLMELRDRLLYGIYGLAAAALLLAHLAWLQRFDRLDCGAHIALICRRTPS